MTPFQQFAIEVLKLVVWGIATILPLWFRLKKATVAAEQAARRAGRAEHHLEDLKNGTNTPNPFDDYDKTPETERTNPRLMLPGLEKK